MIRASEQHHRSNRSNRRLSAIIWSIIAMVLYAGTFFVQAGVDGFPNSRGDYLELSLEFGTLRLTERGPVSDLSADHCWLRWPEPAGITRNWTIPELTVGVYTVLPWIDWTAGPWSWLASFFVPLWPIPALIIWRRRRDLLWRKPTPNHCDICGYDLRGNASGICPECGTVILSQPES